MTVEIVVDDVRTVVVVVGCTVDVVGVVGLAVVVVVVSIPLYIKKWVINSQKIFEAKELSEMAFIIAKTYDTI